MSRAEKLAEILEEVACVAMRDADAIYDSYAWPPRGTPGGKSALSDEERLEGERLTVLSRRLWVHAMEVRGGLR